MSHIASTGGGISIGAHKSVSRDIDTVYQNNSGSPMIVVGKVTCDSDTSRFDARGEVGETTSPRLITNPSRRTSATIKSDSAINVRLFVPDEYYYRFSGYAATGGVALFRTYEQVIE